MELFYFIEPHTNIVEYMKFDYSAVKDNLFMYPTKLVFCLGKKGVFEAFWHQPSPTYNVIVF